jgi:hypothetical protein
MDNQMNHLPKEKMHKLSKTAFHEIRNWIYQNARPLDFALWGYYFENGEKEEVLRILQSYQNSDGGFGNTIDPDNWNPESSPYGAQIVIKMLRQTGFVDVSHPIYQGIFQYLENTKYKSKQGWFFTIPSNNNYPRGVWWNYNQESNTVQNVGTTASLCGFILRYGVKNAPLYQIAIEYTTMLIERLKTEAEHGDMGVGGYCELTEDIKEAGLTDEFDFRYLSDKTATLIREKIQKEKDNFMANPLEFVLSPSSQYYDENREEVEKALDEIVKSRPENGVWGIPWEWYNEHTNSKNFAISENWWKATKATDKLIQLRNFGRLE